MLWRFEILSRRKFTSGIRSTQRSWSLVFSWLALLAVSNALDENESSGSANLSSIANLMRPRFKCTPLRLRSTQESVFAFIKRLACFNFEFSVVSNKAFIEVSIDSLYIYISIYIIIRNNLNRQKQYKN